MRSSLKQISIPNHLQAGVRHKRGQFSFFFYLTLTIFLGALPWMLWTELPSHQGHGDLRTSMLFSTHERSFRGLVENVVSSVEEMSHPHAAPKIPAPAAAEEAGKVKLSPVTHAEKAPLDAPPKAPVVEAEQVVPPPANPAFEEGKKVEEAPHKQADVAAAAPAVAEGVPPAEVAKAAPPPAEAVKAAVPVVEEKEPAPVARKKEERDKGKFLRDSQEAAAVQAALKKKEPPAAAAADNQPKKSSKASVKFAVQDPTASEKLIARQRRERVKLGMMRAWDAYRTHAWGQDVVHPISLKGSDRWGSMAMTMLDSLSTLWVMDLKEEFNEARDWIAKNLHFDHVGSISVFETTIRALAGLLSAYDLSKDQVFLDKATELGDRLLSAFDTPTGFPINGLSLNSGSQGSSHVCLAEFGTLQIEFRFLSHATGNPIYGEKAMKVFEELYKQSETETEHGLFKLDFDANSGQWGGRTYSVAARGDSFYEYLLKTWLQGNRKEDYLREMFDKSVDGMEELLIKRLPSGRMYIGTYNYGRISPQMEHLSCFLPGTLALGSATIETNGDPQLEERQKRYMHLARELGETCYQFAATQATGLAPELVDFPDGDHPHAVDARYILRPEVAESMYYLHLLDGDSKWKEHAALMFDAIDTYCRTDQAYGTARFGNTGATAEEMLAKQRMHEETARKEIGDLTEDVAKPALRGRQLASIHKPPTEENKLVTLEDDMESFFLAETLKYLYLIQETEPGHVDLALQVFNTEAHPLHIFDDSGPVGSKAVLLS